MVFRCGLLLALVSLAPTVAQAATLHRSSAAVSRATIAPRKSSYGSETCGAAGSCRQAILSLLNADRAHYGARPLTLNSIQSRGSGSCVGSLGHSLAMRKSGSIWHVNSSYPQASFPHNICGSFRVEGQNVGQDASGSELSDLQALDGMMMAEPHSHSTCARTVNHACNIINPAFTQVGIGIVHTGSATWLTEDFTG